MDNLYSPWRIDYILTEKKKGCIFCIKPQENDDKKYLILKRGKFSYIIMNLFPYNNAHLMVVPYRHVSNLSLLNDEELFELIKLTQLCEKVINKVYTPDGLNVGINLGESAGAGIAEHLHVHIVPRWNGDTNFISTVGNTRVIPEKMEDTYNKLLKAFESYEL